MKEGIWIIFERGKSPMEYFIMFLQMVKLRRLKLPFREVYSHVSLYVDGDVFTTHPKHGVLAYTFTEGKHPERRKWVKLRGHEEHEVGRSFAKLVFSYVKTAEYDYPTGILQGIEMLTGIWLGRKHAPSKRRPKRESCTKLVARTIHNLGIAGFEKWHRMDMLDIELALENQ